MKEKWQDRYERLSRETDLILLSGPAGTDLVEACFKCTLDHWLQLRDEVLREPFTDDLDEIRFFKYIKPQFTGQLEYYTLLYQYHLFRPPDNASGIIDFIHHEQDKIDRFRASHESFIQYYTGGHTGNDAAFFLSRNYESASPPFPYVRPYELNPAFSTIGDRILTLFIGNGLYKLFLAIECKRLSSLSCQRNDATDKKIGIAANDEN